MPPQVFPSIMAMASRCSLTRAQIIDAFRQRLQTGEQPLLTRAEQVALAIYLRDRLMAMAMQDSDTPNAIRALCEAEKVTLEAGFSREQIQTYFLPEYTRVLAAAIATGQFPLTAQNSYPQLRSHRSGSISRVDRRHHALDFLTYGSLSPQPSDPDGLPLPGDNGDDTATPGLATPASLPRPDLPGAPAPPPPVTSASPAPVAPPLSPDPLPPEDSPVAQPMPDTQRYLEELLAAHRNQAQTLAWATQRIATLEAENAALKATQVDSSRIPALEAELATAQRKLHQIQALLGSGLDPAVALPPAPDAAIAPEAAPATVATTVAAPTSAVPTVPTETSPPGALPEPSPVAPPEPSQSGDSRPPAAEPPAPRKTRRRPSASGTQRATPKAATPPAPPADSGQSTAVRSKSPAAAKPPAARTRTKTARQATPASAQTAPAQAATAQAAAAKSTKSSKRQPPPAPPATPSPGRKGGRALDRAERIFQGIEQWNRQHPEEAFAVTASFLETKFNINRGAAQSFCEAQRGAIQKMHDRIGLSPGRAKYFNRGKNIDEMVQFVEVQIVP